MQYTITVRELTQLAKARSAQVKAFRTFAISRKLRKGPSVPRSRADWANVSFVNGQTLRGAMPVRAMASWARLHGAQATFSLHIEGEGYRPTENQKPFVRLQCGNSAVSFWVKKEVTFGKTKNPYSPDVLGGRLLMTAPIHGGAFTFQSALAQLP